MSREMNEIKFKEIYDRNVDIVYKICYSYMKNKFDSEDIVQEVFVRLIRKNPEFENEKHEKAWLIVTASNLCKNNLKSWKRKMEDIENYESDCVEELKEDNTIHIVLNLPDKYKTVIYLYYYEGYTTIEIAKAMEKNESTVRSLLKRGRDLLRVEIGGEADEKFTSKRNLRSN